MSNDSFTALIKELIAKAELHKGEKGFSFKKHPFYRLANRVFRFELRKTINGFKTNT